MSGSNATASLEETLLILLACATLGEERGSGQHFYGFNVSTSWPTQANDKCLSSTSIVGTRLHVRVGKLISFEYVFLITTA
jgi:hypothetical protein